MIFSYPHHTSLLRNGVFARHFSAALAFAAVFALVVIFPFGDAWGADEFSDAEDDFVIVDSDGANLAMDDVTNTPVTEAENGDVVFFERSETNEGVSVGLSDEETQSLLSALPLSTGSSGRSLSESATPLETTTDEELDGLILQESAESNAEKKEPSIEQVRGSLIASETFTSDSRLSPLRERTSILGDERTIINFGVSYIYDSNVLLSADKRRVETDVVVSPAVAPVAAQTELGIKAVAGSPAVSKKVVRYEDNEIIGGSTMRGDLTLGLQGGALRGTGFYYRLVYGGDIYTTESSLGSDTAMDHSFRGDLGLRGGYTEIRFSAGAATNSGAGNGFRQNTLRREEQRAESVSYDANLSLNRKLATGSLEFGAGYQTEEFDNAAAAGLIASGRSSQSLDAAWFYDPPFLAYTTLGLGLNFGTEELNGGLSQESLTPSIRARWAASPFTSLGAWLGAETRWSEYQTETETTSFSSTTPVFGLDASWQARHSTLLSLGLNRSQQQSISLLNQNITSTRANVSLSQQLQHGRSVAIAYGYEFADYGSTGQAVVSSSQRDNYHQFSTSLNQSLEFGGYLNAQLSIFYNYNLNANEDPALEFEQQILGIRMGMSF